MTVIWQYKTEWGRNIKNSKPKTNDVRYTVQKLAWWGDCRMIFCQEIKCFYRTLSCSNIIIVMRGNFVARNELLSFTFLLFLWDNASQKLRKCELLICTLTFIKKSKTSKFYSEIFYFFQLLFFPNLKATS